LIGINRKQDKTGKHRDWILICFCGEESWQSVNCYWKNEQLFYV